MIVTITDGPGDFEQRLQAIEKQLDFIVGLLTHRPVKVVLSLGKPQPQKPQEK